jgi:hypothetical protein
LAVQAGLPKSRRLTTSNGYFIDLEKIGDGSWNVVGYKSLVGRIDERSGRIIGV